MKKTASRISKKNDCNFEQKKIKIPTARDKFYILIKDAIKLWKNYPWHF